MTPPRGDSARITSYFLGTDGPALSENDLDYLEDLALRRGYAVRTGEDFLPPPERRASVLRGETPLWLEWADGLTPPPSDPRVAEAFALLTPFEPFAFPALILYSFRWASAPWTSPSTPVPTFLGDHPGSDEGERLEGRAISKLSVALAARLELDDDHRARPEGLGWLVSYRDALARQIDWCASRLTATGPQMGGGEAPVLGAHAVLRAWLAEALSVQEGRQQSESTDSSSDPVAIAVRVWEGFKGGRPRDEGGAPSRASVEGHGATREGRLLRAATAAGLRHYWGLRDIIVEQVRHVFPGWAAAESVLGHALAGKPFDDAWVEEAVRRQEQEDAYRARVDAEAKEQEGAKTELRRTLLSDATRLPYILETYHPIASANPKTGSVWADTHALYVEGWLWAGLPEKHPYPTATALKDAVTAYRARTKKRAA